ncbi:hypothetical protein WJX84_008711, partial [Apatococcus fuscideae]
MGSAEELAAVKQQILELGPPEVWPDIDKAALLAHMATSPTAPPLLYNLQPPMFENTARQMLQQLRPHDPTWFDKLMDLLEDEPLEDEGKQSRSQPATGGRIPKHVHQWNSLDGHISQPEG